MCVKYISLDCGRAMPNGTYSPTTWQVRFNLTTVSTGGTYKLWMATASTNVAAIQVSYLLQLNLLYSNHAVQLMAEVHNCNLSLLHFIVLSTSSR